jgi:hypothetical protein
MSVKAFLFGQQGSTKHKAAVDGHGALYTIDRGVPVIVDHDHFRIFRQDFTDDGLSTGSSDMLVDGTAAGNQDFWIPAHSTCDRYICVVSFIIADAGSALNLFGGGAALTNGVRFFYNSTEEDVDIHPAIKINLDLVRMSGQPAFGDGASAFLAGALGGAPPQSGYLPRINLAETFGLRWGVRLRAGSDQKIVLRIQDDLTGGNPDVFNAIAYGMDRLPD